MNSKNPAKIQLTSFAPFSSLAMTGVAVATIVPSMAAKNVANNKAIVTFFLKLLHSLSVIVSLTLSYSEWHDFQKEMLIEQESREQ